VQLARSVVAAPASKPGHRPKGGSTPARPDPTPVVTPPPVVETPPVTPPVGEKKPKDSHIVTDSPYATPKH
jgi:hypothetical protein